MSVCVKGVVAVKPNLHCTISIIITQISDYLERRKVEKIAEQLI